MNDFRFTGEKTDECANRGLVYLRARLYDPALGRFLNRDPLPVGNRYAYVGNNPVTAVDPSGLDGEDPTPVPLPEAGSEEMEDHCYDGWLNCIEKIVPQERFKRRFDSDRYYRTDDPYNDACQKFWDECRGKIKTAVKNPSFDEIGVRRFMREMNRRVESSLIPNVRFRFPNTGSGGFLPQPNRKETTFSSGCFIGSWRW